MTEDEQRELRQRMPVIFTSTPYLSTLGLDVVRYEPDDVGVRLPFREDLTNDGRTYHGGVIATMLDTTGALAAWSNHDFDQGMHAATVSLSIQYLSTSDGTDLVCAATTARRVKELIFTEVDARRGDGRTVAHALQTYRIT